MLASPPSQPIPPARRCLACGGTMAEAAAEVADSGKGLCPECRAKWQRDQQSQLLWSRAFSRESLDAVAAFPVTVMLVNLAEATGILGFLLLPVPVQLHELGHALVAWLSGIFAVPLIGITFTGSLDGSLLVSVVTAGLLAATVMWSRREDTRFLPAVAYLLLGLQLYLSFVVSGPGTQMLISFGGIAGEFVLSTLLVVAFFYRMPASIQWEKWRYVCLFLGMYAFEWTSGFWSDVAAGRKALPKGSLFGGAADSNGDINRLIDQYGWTETSITGAYGLLGMLCTTIIWGHYLFFAARALGLGPFGKAVDSASRGH